jgi:D-alanine-D-alanine ligase
MAGIRVGVLFGGPSAEHEISIRSADTVVESLHAAGCAPLLVHVRTDGTWAFARPASRADAEGGATRLAATGTGAALDVAIERLRREVDVVFPIIHGTFGEDGTLQGFLHALGIPFTGPDLLASALAMDKARAKAVIGMTTPIRVPLGVAIRNDHPEPLRAAALARARRLAFPVVVKPIDAGSSVGLTRLEQPDGLEAALARAVAVEGVTGALVEELVRGDEVTCAVFGNPETGIEALPPILIRPHGGRMFDFEAKYTPGLTDEICPAPLPRAALDRVRESAIAAYLALGCRGFARVDFILNDYVPWFLELNTLPGVTKESLLPKAATAAGWTLPDFFRHLVELALAPARERARLAVAS